MPIPLKRLALLALCSVVAIVGAWLQQGADAPPAHGQSSIPPRPAFVPSMTGTRADGALRQDGQARLVIDSELIYLFDYYLTALGVQPLAAIRSEIGKQLERRLGPGPAAEAKRLLDAYLAYKRALVDLERSLPAAANLAAGARQRLNAMQRLRRSYFSDAEAHALFGDSDAYDLDALARIAIRSDSGLSEAQRQQGLAALDASLPQALRDSREAPVRLLKLEHSVDQARAQGWGENEVYRLRAAALTPAAAARLAELDREMEDWQRRIASYQAQRQQLSPGAGPERLQQLRDTLFSAEEQKRLAAYD